MYKSIVLFRNIVVFSRPRYKKLKIKKKKKKSKYSARVYIYSSSYIYLAKYLDKVLSELSTRYLVRTVTVIFLDFYRIFIYLN